jgi:hypothetical protein
MNFTKWLGGGGKSEVLAFAKHRFSGHEIVDHFGSISITAIWKPSERFPQPGHGYLLFVESDIHERSVEFRILPHRFRASIAAIIFALSLLWKGPVSIIFPVLILIFFLRDYQFYVKRLREYVK